MAHIYYEGADGETETIKRDEYHTDQEPLLTAFNNSDDGGVTHKVSIPLNRVIKIHG